MEFFGKEEKGRFRFVTKFNDVDSLLDAKHNNHTEIRFSINTQRVIDDYEHHTASANKRIEAAAKAAKAGYQIGFIIAPVFLYENFTTITDPRFSLKLLQLTILVWLLLALVQVP